MFGSDKMKTQPLEGLGWIIFLVRVGAPRSLRIAVGGRIVRIGSRRDLVNRASFARNMCCCMLVTFAL
jgi:hypothetical protein